MSKKTIINNINIKKELKKDTKKELKKDTKKELKKDTKKELKKDTKKDLKKDTKKDLKKDTKKVLKKDTKKVLKKDTKKVLKKDTKNMKGGEKSPNIGKSIGTFFTSIPPVFTNLYDFSSNIIKEFESIQNLPNQMKNASNAQPGQPLASLT